MTRYDEMEYNSVTHPYTHTHTHTHTPSTFHTHTHTTFTNTVRCVGGVWCATVPAFQCSVDCSEEKLSVFLFFTHRYTLASVHIVHVRDRVAVAFGAAVAVVMLCVVLRCL
jgi:hypothetical protein